MNAQAPSSIKRYARAEIERRKGLAAQKIDAERDLLAFVKMFWHVMEPETAFIEGWPLETMCDALMAVTDGHVTRLIENVPPGFCKSLLLNVFWPAWEWGPCRMPWIRYIAVSYAAALSERDNGRFRRLITDPLYQRLWGDVFSCDKESVELVENDRTGWKRAISLSAATTGFRGDRILLDDANNPFTVESEVIRNSTNLWLREVMPDRLNDLQKGVIINIQQRTHQQDATATLAEAWRDFVWVCIPMKFDPLRAGSAVLRREKDGSPMEVWNDPRGVDEDGEQLEGLYTNSKGELKVRMGSPMAKAEGSLAWPERFPEKVVEDMERVKQAYAWCNPGDAPILMADLSMRRLDEIRVGDQIVGFETSTAPRRQGDNHARRRLMPATVKAISISERPVVKITLDSGRIIRCTPDHKWYNGRGPKDGRGHPMYTPARRGQHLARVCDPELPVLQGEDLHRAGWLSGIYEGDGSVSVQNRRHRNGEQSTALISIAQGTGRNAEICRKIEDTLTHFGFEWGVAKKRRADTHDLNMYWLKRGGLPVYQRFLHITRTHKWKDRMLQAAMSSNFVRAWERVVSIEPAGTDTVYGLTTTTGNYVVWGLASSNSGQYQQAPTVRGGEIIRRDWWQLWQDKSYPDMGTVVASLDTAQEEHKDADYNAMTIWGAFPGVSGEPKIMLMGSWKARLPLAQLVARVAELCNEQKVDYLLIEHKTRGRDVHDEIVRIYQNAPWKTILVPVKDDKVSRLNAVSHLFSGDVRKDPVSGVDTWSNGMIYAPDTVWADEVINEVSAFPRGAHDDLVDSTSMALGWMRKNGVVLRKVEYDDQETERRKYRKRLPVPYAI